MNNSQAIECTALAAELFPRSDLSGQRGSAFCDAVMPFDSRDVQRAIRDRIGIEEQISIPGVVSRAKSLAEQRNPHAVAGPIARTHAIIDELRDAERVCAEHWGGIQAVIDDLPDDERAELRRAALAALAEDFPELAARLARKDTDGKLVKAKMIELMGAGVQHA